MQRRPLTYPAVGATGLLFIAWTLSERTRTLRTSSIHFTFFERQFRHAMLSARLAWSASVLARQVHDDGQANRTRWIGEGLPEEPPPSTPPPSSLPPPSSQSPPSPCVAGPLQSAQSGWNRSFAAARFQERRVTRNPAMSCRQSTSRDDPGGTVQDPMGG